MANTSIQWTNKAWNPVTGCTKISAGCAHCYAARMAHRLAGRCGYPPAPDEFKVTLHPDRLSEPGKWRKPSMVFVDSMGDLFHPDVPDTFIEMVFLRMANFYWHTFQVLTKRAERMQRFVSTLDTKEIIGDAVRPFRNIWLGVSAENQVAADERIPWLLKTPAAVRFVSVEPMLGPVDLRPYLDIPGQSWAHEVAQVWGDDDGVHGLDWVICGCESGPKARPADIAWVRDLRDQCVEAGTPFFLKQLAIDGKLVKMPELDGRVWDQMPEAHNGRP